MNIPLVREFRLSPKKPLGVRCDADGAFVGAVPLLEHVEGAWAPRGADELSNALGEIYGLPVDASAKRGGLAAVAKALNEGDIARAQIATLFLHFPDALPLAKGTPSQGEIVDLAVALDWAGLLKTDWDPAKHPRYPAKTPGGRGGKFSPKNGQEIQAQDENGFGPDDLAGNFDDPKRGPPKFSTTSAVGDAAEDIAATDAERAAERRAAAAATRRAIEDLADQELRVQLRKAARKAFREAALEALKNAGKKLVLSEIPIVGLIADVSTVYDVYRFAKDMVELRQAIAAATRFANEGAHTLAQLRMSPVSEKFENFDAFLKIFLQEAFLSDLEKRFKRAGDGMEYHHLIERGSRDVGDTVEDSDDIVRIPTIFHEAINARYGKREEGTGSLSLRAWLKTQSISVRREWGKKILRDLGPIVD